MTFLTLQNYTSLQKKHWVNDIQHGIYCVLTCVNLNKSISRSSCITCLISGCLCPGSQLGETQKNPVYNDIYRLQAQHFSMGCVCVVLHWVLFDTQSVTKCHCPKYLSYFQWVIYVKHVHVCFAPSRNLTASKDKQKNVVSVLIRCTLPGVLGLLWTVQVFYRNWSNHHHSPFPELDKLFTTDVKCVADCPWGCFFVCVF